MIFVPENISDRSNLRPGNLRPQVLDIIRQGAAGLGDDFDRPLHGVFQQPVLLIILKTLTRCCSLDTGHGIEHVLQRVTKFAAHQNICTAEFSISALSIG